MVEKITRDQTTKLNPGEHPLRLPFVPIFDTIAYEAVSEPPPTEHEYGYASVSSKGNIDFDFSGARHQTESEIKADYQRSRTSNWIAALATAVIALAVSYLAIQLRKQTQLLTDELAKSSEVLLRAGEETRQLEQRPWVGVADAVAQPLTVTGGAFTLALQNSGKTPALDVHFSGSVMLGDPPRLAAADDASLPVQRSVGVLFPGASYKTILEFRVSLASVAALYRNQVSAVVHVSISYKDVFQRSHSTRSCFYWQPSLRDVRACDQYNTVN
jgi:hypothetical protein